MPMRQRPQARSAARIKWSTARIDSPAPLPCTTAMRRSGSSGWLDQDSVREPILGYRETTDGIYTSSIYPDECGRTILGQAIALDRRNNYLAEVDFTHELLCPTLTPAPPQQQQQVQPTDTPTAMPTDTATATGTSTPTATGTPTATATSTPTNTPDPADRHADPANGYTDPANGYTDPANGYTDPANEHASPADQYTSPRQRTRQSRRPIHQSRQRTRQSRRPIHQSRQRTRQSRRPIRQCHRPIRRFRSSRGAPPI